MGGGGRDLASGLKDQVKSFVDPVVKLNKRQALTQGVNLGNATFCGKAVWQSNEKVGVGLVQSVACCLPGLIITSALMIWKTLILLTGSESPVSLLLFSVLASLLHSC